MSELDRIRAEYDRRAREIPAARYSAAEPGEMFARQSRERALTGLLREQGYLPLGERRVLDVGCGYGQFLADFETWGAERSAMAGIDLDPARAEAAAARLPGADIRAGNAGELPWPDASFDLVLQSVVFSSILDHALRRAVAAEMARVLAPGGALLWYDFTVDNPRNRAVRGVRRRELAELFPGFQAHARRIMLAPPVARRLAPRAWLLASALESARVFNTHLVAVLRRP